MELLPHLDSFQPIPESNFGFAANGDVVYLPVHRLIPYHIDGVRHYCYERKYELMRNGEPINGSFLVKQLPILVAVRQTSKKVDWYEGVDGNNYLVETAGFHAVGLPMGLQYRPVYDWMVWAINTKPLLCS